MAYDLEEQEQLDEFKAWWNKHGKMVTNVVIAALVAYVGWQAYHFWLNKTATEASTLYQTLITADAKNVKGIEAQAKKIRDDYASTPYAGRAALYAAKALYTGQQGKKAETELHWAMQNAKETSVQAIAGLELAGIQYENKDYDNAVKTLSAIKDIGYEGLKQNLLGDILLAKGNTTDAKKAFETALEHLDQKGRLFLLTKQKLESLGA